MFNYFPEKMKNYLFLAISSLFLTSCAMPDVVQTKQLSDGDLGCGQLAAEIAKCESATKEIQGEKGFTGKNTAAVLFFWPALIATHCNVNEAVTALNQRQAHLMDLYKEKKCNNKF